MSSPLVTAIIVSYLSEDIITAALDALAACVLSGYAQCIVVDNSPNDATVSLIRRRYEWVRLIVSGRNLGYGGGCNLAFREVTTPYVVFLNPDAVVHLADLAELVNFLERHPNAGLAGPAMLEGDGALETAGGLPTPWRVVSVAAGRASGRHPIVPGHTPRRTDWLCGAVLAAPTELIRTLGGFDPRFFLYFEETDLCKRVTDSGREIWAVGEIVVRHCANASARRVGGDFIAGCIPEHYYRSRFYYLVKHHGWAAAVAAELAELAVLALRDVIRRFAGRPDRLFAKRWHAPLFRLPART